MVSLFLRRNLTPIPNDMIETVLLPMDPKTSLIRKKAVASCRLLEMI